MVLRRQNCWTQISAKLHGNHKGKSRASLQKSAKRSGDMAGPGYGGHFRAVQGFRYIGNPEMN
jgi:hypothetical protein